MTDSTPITVKATLDHALASPGRNDVVRYLVVVLDVGQAPENLPDFERRCHNLGFAIDRSSTMSGRPLEAAKRFVQQVAGRLDNRDVVSVVAFDEKSEVLVPGVRADAAGQRAVTDALKGIDADGSSRLWRSWRMALQPVAGQYPNAHERVTRMFVITDGVEDGINPLASVFARHSSALAERGLPTTALSVSDRPSLAPLIALNDRQIDWIYADGDLESLGRFAVAEYLEVDPVAARDVRMQVSAHAHAIEPIQQLESTERGEVKDCLTEVELGDLRYGARKLVVFRLDCAEGKDETKLGISVDVTWTDPVSGVRVEPLHEVSSLTFGSRGKYPLLSRNNVATNTVASMWVDTILRDVLYLNRSGAIGAASWLVAEQLHEVEQYCQGEVEARFIFHQLLEGIRIVHEPWFEMSGEERKMRRVLGKRLGYITLRWGSLCS